MSDAYEGRYREPQRSSGSGKWILLGGCGCVALLVVCVGGCGILGYIGLSELQKSKPYTESVARANANTEVTNDFGSPIEGGWMIQGTINVNNAGPTETGNVDVIIPLKGPKGEGSVHVVGRTTNPGQWDYTKMDVTTPAGKSVDLLKDTKTDGKKK